MLTSSSDIGQETDNHRHDDAKDPKRSEHLLVNECTSLLHSSPVEQQQRQTPGTSKDYNPSVSFNFDDQSEHEDEEESSIMLAEEGRRSRQNSSSFLTRSTTAASDSKSTTSRSSNHWKKLRGHIQRGSFLLIPQANQHGNHHNMEQEESSSSHNNSPAGKKRRSSGMSSQVEDRAQVMEEMIQEIREGMTFTVNQCIWAMVAFVLLSIVCYSFILEPSWTMLESCHYAMSTVLTVGYGNYVPTTDISRLFTCLYVLVGVSFLGVVLGIIGSSIMDHHSRSKEASDAMKRYQVLSLFSPSSSFGQDSDCESKKQDLQSATTLIDQDSKESSLHALSMQSIRTSRRSALLLHYVYHSPFLPLLIASCLLGGSIGYISKWSFISTLYFMVTSACTIGFGDFIPTSTLAVLLDIFYLPLACGTCSIALGSIAQSIMERRSAQFRSLYYTQRHKELTPRDLMAMDVNGDGKVSWAEFLEFMLIAMKKVDAELIEELQEYFGRLDVCGTGELSREDLIALARKKLASPDRRKELAIYKKKLLEQAESRRRLQEEQHGHVASRRGSVWDSFAGALSGPNQDFGLQDIHQRRTSALWDSIARFASSTSPAEQTDYDSVLDDDECRPE